MAGTGSIHYKFKSARSFETVFFEGHEISPGELRMLICEKKVCPLPCESFLAVSLNCRPFKHPNLSPRCGIASFVAWHLK